MLLIPMLVALALAAAPEPVVSQVPCQTVADCWLDDEGGAIKRPKKFKGKELPKGDCGRNLRWLRNRLTCEANLCTVLRVGDRC